MMFLMPECDPGPCPPSLPSPKVTNTSVRVSPVDELVGRLGVWSHAPWQCASVRQRVDHNSALPPRPRRPALVVVVVAVDGWSSLGPSKYATMLVSLDHSCHSSHPARNYRRRPALSSSSSPPPPPGTMLVYSLDPRWVPHRLESTWDPRRQR